MYKQNKTQKTSLKINESYQGERIEEKIHRIVNNKEPITDGAPLIYTDRKDGILPDYDIRTDRFEVAIEAHDKIQKSHIAKREQTLAEKAKKGMETEKNTETKNETKTETKNKSKDGGAEPLQGTENK